MPRRSGYLACVALVCLVAASCTPGVVTATTKVSITGKVLDASGTPIAGATVLLVGLATPTSTAAPAPSPGAQALACFLGNAPDAHPQAPCATAREATTDQKGNYSFTMNGAETANPEGAPITFVAAPIIPARTGHPAEPGTSASFTIQQGNVTVPSLQSWGVALATATATSQMVTSWTALPAADATDPSYTLAFVNSSGATVWTANGVTSGASIDPRVLEDSDGGFEVEATTSVQGSGTTFQVTFRTAAAAFRGPGPPPSRGASCSATRTPTQTAQPCTLTSGNLASAAPTPVGQGGLIIDLGTPRPISFVVIRGTGGNLLVESSPNGTTWSSVGGIYALPSNSTLTPTIPEPARYLRARTASGNAVSQLTQISVW